MGQRAAPYIFHLRLEQLLWHSPIFGAAPSVCHMIGRVTSDSLPSWFGALTTTTAFFLSGASSPQLAVGVPIGSPGRHNPVGVSTGWLCGK